MRTEAEVEALWPKVNRYKFKGNVVIEAHSAEGVASVVQQLYEGSQAIAGEFQVSEPIGVIGNEKTFPITFIRDVCDDKDVVEPLLTDGGDLRQALVKQMELEIKNAIKETGIKIFIYLTDGPYF